jgi:hypothetical protein
MTTTQHTPGPWAVLDDDGYVGVPFIPIQTDKPAGAPWTLICEVRGNGNDNDPDLGLNDEDRANARLIAAAPDLLTALKLALPILEGANAKCTGETAFIRRVRAAIAKAEGR